MKRGRNQHSPNPRFLSDTHKECSLCEEIKPLTEFHNCNGGPANRAYYCKMCACKKSREQHKERTKDPISKRKYSSRYKKTIYGLSPDEYDAKYKAQQRCAICSISLLGGTQTHLDHNHTTGQIREFLCTNCNRGLGHFQESKQLLMNAIQYLEKHTDNAESEGRAAVHE